jgi:hypothetical protein
MSSVIRERLDEAAPEAGASQPYRAAALGRIDRSRPLEFTFDERR